MIFATTHKHALKDALINRFGSNVYEMRRPAPREVLAHVHSLCVEMGVTAPPERLLRVVEHYGCDLRKCVDFAYCAKDQAPDRIVAPDFVDDVLGIEHIVTGELTVPSKRTIKL